MNTEPPITGDEGSMEHESIGPQPQPFQKKKRRWWVYVLIGVGALVMLAVVAFIALFSYYRSLIKNYTDIKPRQLPAIEVSKEKVQQLGVRWKEFTDKLFSKEPPEPFVLTEDDINQMICNFGNAKDFLRVKIEGNKIKALFTVPLDMTNKKELKGKYLNGTATLALQLEDGFLKLNVESALVNDKPAPGWIVNQIKKKNILENLENNYDFLQILQELEDVQVKDGGIVFIPAKK